MFQMSVLDSNTIETVLPKFCSKNELLLLGVSESVLRIRVKVCSLVFLSLLSLYLLPVCNTAVVNAWRT